MRTLFFAFLLILYSCSLERDDSLEPAFDVIKKSINADTLVSLPDSMMIDTAAAPADTFPPYAQDTLNVDSTEITLDTSSSRNDVFEIPPNFVEVYSTSFEEVKEKNRHTLRWEIPHWIEYQAMHIEDGGQGNGLGGGQIWVEKGKAHTGSQSIGLSLFDISKSRRTELVIFPDSYLKDEYYISYWVYLPEEWGLYDPTIDWDWFEIGNPFNSNGTPYSAIHIIQATFDQTYFNVALNLRDEQGKMNNYGQKRIKLTKNAWFNISYYVRRSHDDGAIKLWFDDQLIGDVSGIPTMRSKDTGFNVSIAKIYHERGDTTQHSLWIDDLKLFTTVED